METETLPDARVSVTDAHGGAVLLIVAGRGTLMDKHDLQSIVQQAYDQHGILAEPSYAIESGGTAAVHAMAMAHNAGVRA